LLYKSDASFRLLILFKSYFKLKFVFKSFIFVAALFFFLFFDVLVFDDVVFDDVVLDDVVLDDVVLDVDTDAGVLLCVEVALTTHAYDC
jgi:hypothetical protein